MKGLFYHHKKYRLPDGYDALAFDEDSVQKWPANVLDDFNENIFRPLLAHSAVTLGNGVFSYRLGVHKTDPNATCWIFVFYEHADFVGLTLPPLG